MPYQFKKVESERDVNEFHELPFSIYKPFPKWKPPFRFEIEQIFDPQKNPYFQQGECERYLVFERSRIVARFAVMNHSEKDKNLDPPMGGFGFLELENSQELAGSIIHFIAEWHDKRGYGAFRGPINFGENINFWGLLVENYEEPPVYGMNYHPPYYKTLLENTGAQKMDDHFSYKRRFDQPTSGRLEKIASRIERREGLEFRPIQLDRLKEDAEIIRTIYNQAWGNQEIPGRDREFTELTSEMVQGMVQKLESVMIPESILIAFMHGEPASFVISIPDLNELSAETRGRLRWWQLPKLYRFKRRVKNLRTIAFGTVPAYRKLGLDALLFLRGIEMTKKSVPTLEYLEGGWVSEKNWLMQRSLEALGCSHHKTHRTYKWEING